MEAESEGATAAEIVVVFDFDKTIIDCDSNNWVVDGLGATELFERLLPTMPWNSLMDMMMRELHSQGKSIEDIAECLKKAPLDPHIIDGIRSAYAVGCDLRVVSDANLFSIETILKHHGILECFSEINTNPSYVDGDGRLRIFPYHDFNTSPHGCSLCPPNMCKVTYRRMKGALNQLSLTVQKGPVADLILVLFGEKQPIRSKSVMQFALFNKNLDNSQLRPVRRSWWLRLDRRSRLQKSNYVREKFWIASFLN